MPKCLYYLRKSFDGTCLLEIKYADITLKASMCDTFAFVGNAYNIIAKHDNILIQLLSKFTTK